MTEAATPKRKPKRRSVKRFPCDDVQGEGSYVILAGVKVREIRSLRKMSDQEATFDDFEEGLKLLTKHIVEWNWVGDDGEFLAQPKENPEVMNELTDEETEFLVRLLIPSLKN